MSVQQRDEEARAARLRSRLWGATVLIAVLVIVLPLVLDGSGSESRFRRVETLREEPPRVLGADGRQESAGVPDTGAQVRIHIGEDDPPDYMRTPPSPRAVLARERTATLSAWVVQAGSFAERENALAVRDTLRRAGYASFVVPREGHETLFRVQVGPMIDERVARDARGAVAELIGLEATLLVYP